MLVKSCIKGTSLIFISCVHKKDIGTTTNAKQITEGIHKIENFMLVLPIPIDKAAEARIVLVCSDFFQ